MWNWQTSTGALLRGAVLGMMWVGSTLAQGAAQADWRESDIRTSHTTTVGGHEAPAQALWTTPPENVLTVVEPTGRDVSLLDTDRLQVLHRFALPVAALHDQPKLSPDRRYAYFSSHDGWIIKYDLQHLKVVTQVRAGIDLRDLAVSRDGRHVLAGNQWPHSVVLFDSDLRLLKLYPVRTLDRKQSSRVAAVHDLALRQSFMVVLQDMRELWEISYNPQAEPIYNGYVHDYRMGESLPEPGMFGVRRTPLSVQLSDFFFTPDQRFAIGSTQPPTGNPASVSQVISLEARSTVTQINLPGMPRPSAGASWSWQRPDGSMTTVLAVPDRQAAGISVIDLQTWKTITRIATPGPCAGILSHASSRHAWVDAGVDPASGHQLVLIDKTTLQPVSTLTSASAQTLRPLAFTHDGKQVLVNLHGEEDVLIVYDASTRQEVKRLRRDLTPGQHGGVDQNPAKALGSTR